MYKTVSNISPYYLSKSLDLSEPKRKGLRSQHNLNIPRTSKKAGDQAFFRCWTMCMELSSYSDQEL